MSQNDDQKPAGMSFGNETHVGGNVVGGDQNTDQHAGRDIAGRDHITNTRGDTTVTEGDTTIIDGDTKIHEGDTTINEGGPVARIAVIGAFSLAALVILIGAAFVYRYNLQTPTLVVASSIPVIPTEIPITAIPTFVPTAVAVTLANTSVPPTEVPTVTPLPSLTPLPAPTTIPAGADLSMGCINSVNWTPDAGLAHAQDSQGCWQLSDWGLSALPGTGLSITLQNTPEDLFHGIHTPISTSARIDLDLTVENFDVPNNLDGNIALGVVSTDQPFKESGRVILIQVETPEDNAEIYVRPQAFPNLPMVALNTKFDRGIPRRVTLFIYPGYMTLSLDGNAIGASIPIPYANRLFWIGYTLPAGGNLSATLSNISVKPQ